MDTRILLDQRINNKRTALRNFPLRISILLPHKGRFRYKLPQLLNQKLLNHGIVFCNKISKNRTGYTFLEMLTFYRIRAAVEYLQKTDKKVYEIAYAIGYNDSKKLLNHGIVFCNKISGSLLGFPLPYRRTAAYQLSCLFNNRRSCLRPEEAEGRS